MDEFSPYKGRRYAMVVADGVERDTHSVYWTCEGSNWEVVRPSIAWRGKQRCHQRAAVAMNTAFDQEINE